MAWLGIDAILEITQKYGDVLIDYLPQWVVKIPLAENLPNYLVNGTFDIYDLLAVSAGALVAFFIGHFTTRGSSDAKTA